MRKKVNQRNEVTDCGVEASLELIGGKWKGVIVYLLLAGTKRNSELRRALPKVTQRMLTRQLRELERDGLVLRKIYPEVPPKVEYRLSELGGSLRPIIELLKDWGEQNVLVETSRVNK